LQRNGKGVVQPFDDAINPPSLEFYVRRRRNEHPHRADIRLIAAHPQAPLGESPVSEGSRQTPRNASTNKKE
jgi:hypothetical protein